jgi:hypothetical protein
VHFPLRYDEKRKKFTTVGNFCSWECSKAYGIDMKSARWGEMQMYLALMRKQALGKYTPVFSAPKREALKVFGGTMTIEEFRSYQGKQPPPVEFPNQIQLNQVVNGVKLAPTAPTNEQPVGDDELVLKRSKPLLRAKSKLESALGITRKAK